VLRAPIKGVILKRDVNPGQTIAVTMDCMGDGLARVYQPYRSGYCVRVCRRRRNYIRTLSSPWGFAARLRLRLCGASRECRKKCRAFSLHSGRCDKSAPKINKIKGEM
jgi:hypothetical protein